MEIRASEMDSKCQKSYKTCSLESQYTLTFFWYVLIPFSNSTPLLSYDISYINLLSGISDDICRFTANRKQNLQSFCTVSKRAQNKEILLWTCSKSGRVIS